MPSGGKEMYINTLERAVSTDILRIQKFANSDRAELLRFLMDVDYGDDDVNVGTPGSQISTTTNPLTAEIIGGLLVRPQATANDLYVDGGVGLFLAPDAALDDSNYKYIVDPGISTLGVIQVAANSSGLTRVDIVECQPASNANAETDNRDIFNPLTNSFSPATVSKAVQGYLTYRVRQGTPGSGFPGTVSGWLPLAVAVVPTGSTNNNSVTFWDVRPLVADRVHAPYKLGYHTGRIFDDTLQIDEGYGLVGHVECVGADWTQTPTVPGRTRLGGDFNYGIIGAQSLANTNTAVISAAGVGANGPGWVYLLEPFGLPRWAQYPPILDSNTPQGPKGILTVSNVTPVPLTGSPSAGIYLPSGTGLGGYTGMGMCVAAVKYAGGNPVLMTNDGRAQWISSSSGVLYSRGDITAAGPTYTFTATPTGIDTNNAALGYPPNARALWVRILCWYTVPANTTIVAGISVTLEDLATNVLWISDGGMSVNLVNPNGTTYPMFCSALLKIPVPNRSVDFGASPPMGTGFSMLVGSGSGTSTRCQIQVTGWDLF